MNRKQIKKRSQRRDYEKRRNINRQTPSVTYQEEKAIKQVVVDRKTGERVKDENGTPLVITVGTRTVTKRRKKLNKKGEQIRVGFPKSRKYKPKKGKHTKKVEKTPQKAKTDAKKVEKSSYNVNLCKNCQKNARRIGSAYCQECSDKHKKGV